MKRSASSKKSGASPPPDFKRLKAKVGKRAPKPLNVTDTSFQTASVNVRTQRALSSSAGAAASSSSDAHAAENAGGESLELISSRGNTLSHLLLQLRHHAPAARTSALAGIRDAIAIASDVTLRANLSSILPSIGKCLIDDDGGVRRSAIGLVSEVLPRCGAVAVGPFVPLTVAYVTSALNSLDEDIRLDGTWAAEVVAIHCPMHMVKGIGVVGMIPAYGRILAESKAGKGGGSKKKKRKRKGKDNAEEGGEGVGRIAVLRSLVSLLRCYSGSNSEEEREMVGGGVGVGSRNGGLAPPLAEVDLRYLPGGIKTNSLLVTRRCQYRSSARAVSNLLTAHVRCSAAQDHISASGWSAHPSSALSISDTTFLLSTLRNVHVELTQRGHTHGSSGLYLSLPYMSEFQALISSVHLFWDGYVRHLVLPCYAEYENDDGETKKLRKLNSSFLSLLLESFPVKDESGNPGNVSTYESVNASLCSTLSELGSVLGNERGTEEEGIVWAERVLGYVLPRLRSTSGVKDEDPREDGARAGNESSVDVLLMKVVSDLLLFRQNASHLSENRYLLNESSRQTLMEAFRSTFFPQDQSEISEELIGSPVGRKAALLLTSLVAQEQGKRFGFGSGDDDDSTSVGTMVRDMVPVMTAYLRGWGGQFPEVSRIVLSSLLGFVRRYKVPLCSSEAGDGIIASLRDGIGCLFTSKSPHKRKKKKRKRTAGSCETSIFEQYPDTVQRLALGLVGMLQYPTNDVVDGLTTICTRSAVSVDNDPTISDDVASFVLEMMDSIKRTMPMQKYLTFVVGSMGIGKKMKDFGSVAVTGGTTPETTSRTVATETAVGGAERSNKRVEGNPEMDKELISTVVTDEADGKDDAAVDNGKNRTTSVKTPVVHVPDIQSVFVHDVAVSRACRSILQCGGVKVLPMLSPVLCSWLGANATTGSCVDDARLGSRIERTLRARTALALLASMALDVTVWESDRSSTTTTAATATSSILDKVPELEAPITMAICDLFLSSQWSCCLDNEEEGKGRFDRLLKPVVALLGLQRTIFQSVVVELSNRFCDRRQGSAICHMNGETTERTVKSLFILIKSTPLIAVMREEPVSTVLLNLSTSVEAAVANGPLDRLGAKLRTEVQLLVRGRVKQL